MSNLSARAFKGGNHASMYSNAITVQNQGGGAAKAGFAYQIGRSWRSSIAFNTCNPDKTITTKCCATLKFLQFTTNPKVSESRPVGLNRGSNRYFHVPGTGR